MDAAENLPLGRECVESGVEDRGQMGGVGAVAGSEPGRNRPLLLPTPSQRGPREWDQGAGHGQQLSMEVKEVVLEAGGRGEKQEDQGAGKEDRADGEGEEQEDQGAGKEDRADGEEEPDEDSQCLSSDTDTEIVPQDAWECTECYEYNAPLQRYCVCCWALRKKWYKDVPLLVHSVSAPDNSEAGLDCTRTVSDPVVLPSHCRPDRPLPTLGSAMGKAPLAFGLTKEEPPAGGQSQESVGVRLEPCKLCRARPRNGTIVHGCTAHLLTCYPCAERLHESQAPCPGCGKIIQKVIEMCFE